MREVDNDIVIYQGNKGLTNNPRGAIVQVRSKSLKIAGKTYEVGSIPTHQDDQASHADNW